jgi:hypothetical protein
MTARALLQCGQMICPSVAIKGRALSSGVIDSSPERARTGRKGGVAETGEGIAA